MKNNRYIASVLIEAETPLSISSGETDMMTDSKVQTDANGLPLIHGTSIAGILRHHLNIDESNKNQLFGYQGEKLEEGSGSRLKISHAHLVGNEGKVIEGLQSIDWEDGFYEKFLNLPIRDHVRISDRGSAENQGKYDEQVVCKGARFRFEIELEGEESDQEIWNQILSLIRSPLFRIGGGSRRGFGRLKIVEIHQKSFNLSEELDSYLKKSASLNDLSGLEEAGEIQNLNQSEKDLNQEIIRYRLVITPEDFWSFGSGCGDDVSDMIPQNEPVIEWSSEGIPSFTEERILVPASSVKGALSHRTVFHYNRLKEKFVDKERQTPNQNAAVKNLFGTANDSGDKKRGNVLFSDLILDIQMKDKDHTKIFNHVSIDRFSGGGRDGALFDEKVVSSQPEMTMNIDIENKNSIDKEVLKAFEWSLKDVCMGMLPLGGGTMRGHGVFTGKVYKNDEELI